MNLSVRCAATSYPVNDWPGNLCHTVGDYQRGYGEASEALEVGHLP